MLFRKIENLIESHFREKQKKILLIDGARQVGKTYIVRHVGRKLFANFIEINMIEDSIGDRMFADVRTTADFYFHLSSIAGKKMHKKENTLVFIDEIQVYPHLLTMLKFLADEDRFTYIASGSLLGVTLAETTSIPMGSIRKVRMFPLDFEEFLYANGFGKDAVNSLRDKFLRRTDPDPSIHSKLMDLFRKYLIAGGMPEAVNAFIETGNVVTVREIQQSIREYYAIDASKYDEERKLSIRRIYDLIPSNMEKKKKRIRVRDINNKEGDSFRYYTDEFEYLISSGISIAVQAVADPVFPLIESSGKNLLKLYMNDTGLLTEILYGNNIHAITNNISGINLGSVYENVVACELAAHGHRLFYYDNRKKGEVDFLVDDYENLSCAPLEIKSGKDYTRHSALSMLVSNKDYNIQKAYVFSNTDHISVKGNVTYFPIYFIMFF